MYGDPGTTWGICLELHLSYALDADAVSTRVGELCARWSHLGVSPRIARHGDAGWATARAEVAAAPYGATSPLLRVALNCEGTALLVGAHHGVVDGLGLLSVAAAVIGRELRTSARGIGDRSAPQGFVRSSFRRLGEALIDPPARFGGVGEGASRHEDLTAITRSRVDRGTADLAAAVLGVHDHGSSSTRRRRVLVIGASRRRVDLPTPDRQTAYLRLRVASGSDPVLGQVISGLRPEPDFPETSAKGTAPLALRLLRNRLGATAMLSNLGLVSGDGVSSLAMYPASSGPHSVAVGLASTATTTTLSVRTRRAEFSAAEHARLLAGFADRFFA